jgi:hypothetical protein
VTVVTAVDVESVEPWPWATALTAPPWLSFGPPTAALSPETVLTEAPWVEVSGAEVAARTPVTTRERPTNADAAARIIFIVATPPGARAAEPTSSSAARPR